MLRLFKDWSGAVEVDGIIYDSIESVNLSHIKDLDNLSIKLLSNTVKPVKTSNTQADRVDTLDGEYIVEVKPYMCKKSTPQFDFMAKFNNDNPMPFRIMQGKIIKQTKGMYQLKLKATDMVKGEKYITCMCCGRKLTNTISKWFGIGPECSGNYWGVDTSDLDKAQEEVFEKLETIEWTGWAPKSACTLKEVK